MADKPQISKEMIDILNQRLNAVGSVLQIVQGSDQGVRYDSQLVVDSPTTILSPFLIDQHQYTNCTSVAQQISQKLTKTLEASGTWSIKTGFEIGATAEVEAGVVFAKAKVGFSLKLNLEHGYSETKREATTFETDFPLSIPPMRRVTSQWIVQQEEAKDVPFVINLLLQEGTFEFTDRDSAPLYRYVNDERESHFYTANFDELGEGRDGYRREGTACIINRLPRYGMVPLWRYGNTSNGNHLYTTNLDELGIGADPWIFEGVAGFVHATKVEGTVPLHRYSNPGTGDYFYTTDWAELGDGREGYSYEGVACYVRTQGQRKPIAAELPSLMDRNFQVHGTFKGTALVRETDVLVREAPMTPEACAVLGGSGAAPLVPGQAGAYRSATAEAGLRDVVAFRRTDPGVFIVPATRGGPAGKRP